ncbi:ATP-binding protein [Patescibacteria group bacterium]|nr:ATP-binding protein [Patescibacteria group bacterium]
MPAQSVTETTATLPIQEEALQPQKQPAEPILPATKTGSIGNPVQRLIQKAKNTFRPPEDTALLEAEKFSRGLVNLQDLLAPSAIEVDFNHIQIGDTYYRTYFIISYPREVGANWLAPLINFAAALDISMFYYPVQAKTVLSNLRRKITELQAELNIEQKGGRILDPDIQLALNDAKKLQEEITAERQRFFQFGLYITVPAKDKKELIATCHQLESILGSIMVAPRSATLQMEDAIKLTIPYFNDTLKVSRNMDTTSIATTLPFTSSSLSSDQGIMYGINEHNGSLIIFDRFQMENANSVIFGTSGSGKSYMIKLEAVRSLMLGTDIIIIDPENEYKTLCDAIGGAFIDLNFSSESRINPFDISRGYSTGENELNVKILTLHSLFKTMLGEMNAAQEAMLDRALIMTYRLKGITQNPETHSLEPPLLEDLYKVFLGMEEEEGKNLADRLEKFVLGSAKGLFNRQTNMDLDNTFIVYGVRDLPDSVRPIGMFLILDFIWTRIRHDRKKRILLVDEAWLLMKYPDSAQFLYSVAKRGRKYYLGLTTITQNIDEFLAREEGKAIINNASIRILMKQSSSAIDQLAKTFYLSEGEKNLLLSANVGEGIFFAGKSHVAMQVVASNDEHRLITTNPAELRLLEQQEKSEDATDG